MGLRVLTSPTRDTGKGRALAQCLHQSDVVLLTGKADAESAVIAGMAYALERPVVLMCGVNELTSSNIAAVADSIIHDSTELQDELWAALRKAGKNRL